jgi:hypothetical protein
MLNGRGKVYEEVGKEESPRAMPSEVQNANSNNKQARLVAQSR